MKLAAALLYLEHRTNPENPRIPFDHAQQMTADQILSLYQWHHHPIPHEEGGPDEPWNITPIMIAEHRHITAKETTPRRGKIRRNQEKWADFVAKMQEKAGVDTSDIPEANEAWFKKAKLRKPKRPWPSRPFPKRKKP